MKRPLVPVALCYSAGLLLAEYLPLPPGTLLGWTAVALVTTLCWRKYRPLSLGLLLALCGWTNLVLHTQTISPIDLRHVVGSESRLATISGTLVETPSLRVFDAENLDSFRSLARVQVEALTIGDRTQSAWGDVIVMTGGVLPAEFHAGQQVQIRGILMQPMPPVARGLFDYQQHLARQEIFYQLKAGSAADWTLVSSHPPPFTDRFVAWASRTLALGMPVEDEELRLNWAMVLGWKTALTNTVSTPFMRSGTMHIFAISGLHIALIAAILVSVLRVLRVSRLFCGLVVIPLIWFYTAATGWQSSAIRSTVMMTVIIGGWALNRPSDLINSLAVAALAILLWQPQQLFQPSFQLSFFVVLSIALFLPPLELLRDRALRTDPLLPKELLPRWRRWLETPLRWLGTSLATSIAAWLGSLPLTAYYFHLFSPVTLLANMIIVPLSSLALAAALGSLACGAWFPAAAELFNHSAWLWMKWMVVASEWSTRLPGAYVYVPAPPWWAFVIYYTTLFGLLGRKLFTPGWHKMIWLLLLAAAGAGVADWQRSRKEIQITVLPLNGGHAVYVNRPGRIDDLLVDCGASNSVNFITLPLLRTYGVNHLPRLTLTHGDMQDVGGTELLRAELPITEVEVGTTTFRSPVYRSIMRALEHSQTLCRRMTNGTAFAGWTVLHPAPEDKFPQADDASLVLRGEFHGIRVLLLADLGRPGQETLLRRSQADLQADIIVSGLPEKSEPLSAALLERVQPRLIIVADSDYPAPARAGRALKDRLRATGLEVIYTRDTGAAEITIHPQGWSYTTARTRETRSFRREQIPRQPPAQ